MPRKQMSREELGALYDRALVLVNKARAAFDMKLLDRLPKGSKGEPQSCPLAIALDHDWAVGGTDVEGVNERARKVLLKVWADELPEAAVREAMAPDDYEPDWVELPAPLSEFVDRFDSGEFPDLIETDADRQR